MPREEAILSLLAAAGPASRADLIQDTGWGIAETNAVVDRLFNTGQIVPFPGDGINQFAARRLCLPETRAQALKRARKVGHAR